MDKTSAPSSLRFAAEIFPVAVNLRCTSLNETLRPLSLANCHTAGRRRVPPLLMGSEIRYDETRLRQREERRLQLSSFSFTMDRRNCAAMFPTAWMSQRAGTS